MTSKSHSHPHQNNGNDDNLYDRLIYSDIRSVSFDDKRLSGVRDPVFSDDAATKHYVDRLFNSLKGKKDGGVSEKSSTTTTTSSHTSLPKKKVMPKINKQHQPAATKTLPE